ncbi:hypothetical protein CU097_015157 [Rhizopus azygosporus]|uniref:Uncharacterized protein n=1 Tax=Rhizopus azygosporus TaxID=86630 RepID=A0A367KCQ0_RHIAZ|nr:hypothetical protein CU097_015157 [Rhizopus azygosporus]
MGYDTLVYSGQDNRIDDDSNLAANIVNRGIVSSLQNGIRSNSSISNSPADIIELASLTDAACANTDQ